MYGQLKINYGSVSMILHKGGGATSDWGGGHSTL